MPALVRYGVDVPHVAGISHGGYIRVGNRSHRPSRVELLHLALSGDFLGVFTACASPAFVPCRRTLGNRLGYGERVIVILF